MAIEMSSMVGRRAPEIPTARRSRGVPENGLLRRLGVLERLFHLVSRQASTNFGIAAEIRGHLDRDALRKAFEQVILRHPLLAARVGTDADGHLAFLRSEPTVDLAFLRRPLSDWPIVAARSVATPMDGATPPLRGCVLVEDEERFALVLTFNHVMADGMSAIAILRDLTQALAGRPLSPSILPASLDTCVDVAPASPSGPIAIDARALDSGPAPTAATTPRITSAVLDRASTDALLAACRRNGTSLNAAFCAAQALVSGAPERILNAVNMRAMAGVSDDVCGFFTSAFVHELARGDFWAMARSMSQATVDFRARPVIQDMLSSLTQSIRSDADVETAVAAWAAFDSDVVVSNLGALRIEPHVGELEIGAIWGPMVWVHNPGRPHYGVCSLEGALHMIEANAPDSVPMLDRVVQRLEACGRGKVR